MAIVRVGASPWTFGDFYHSILTMPWSLFLLAIVGTQVLANVAFGFLYWLQANDISNATGFVDDFYFSVQTWATVGYGGMTPTTTYANMVMVSESITGIVFTAVTTGLVFAKFARPTARVLFANKLTVTRRDGKRFLMLRVANERGNDVVEASARMTLLRDEVSAEGEVMRRLYDLPLVRDTQPLFIITWTIMHEIDEKSPFWGKTSEEIVRDGWRLTVSLMGHDGTVAQTIHANRFYRAEEIEFDARYIDVTSRLPDGRMQIDLRRFHEVEPQPSPALAATSAGAAPVRG